MKCELRTLEGETKIAIANTKRSTRLRARKNKCRTRRDDRVTSFANFQPFAYTTKTAALGGSLRESVRRSVCRCFVRPACLAYPFITEYLRRTRRLGIPHRGDNNIRIIYHHKSPSPPAHARHSSLLRFVCTFPGCPLTLL